MPNRAQYKTKAEFVRSMPYSTKPADVIAAAKAAGLDVKPNDIYAARRYQSKREQVEVVRKPSEAEQQFRKLVVRIGLQAARDILDELDASTSSVRYLHQTRGRRISG